MNYRAMKIGLTCDEPIVRAWASFMKQHLDEVSAALRNENVRHEMWFMGRDAALYVIGVMDVDDHHASQRVSAKSCLQVDTVHREFKKFWDRDRAELLPINPAEPPHFNDCELLFEARS